jgi:NAD(P)-dependent dehydrogenase (short-subunit alcohol dehydrogenase family)
MVDELNSAHGKGTAIGVVADVSSSDDVKNLIDSTVEQLGPLSVMIANAGIAQVLPVLELTSSDVRKIFDVNFHGVFNCYVHAARQMIKQGPVPQGEPSYKIIGCSSIAAFKPFPTLAHYCATKMAVRTFSHTFASEVARHKINVNCYAPGIVATPMWDLVDEKLGEIEGRPKGDSLKKYSTELTALGRASEPQDVADVVGGFLCGKDAEWVTGQTIIVDGGIVFS